MVMGTSATHSHKVQLMVISSARFCHVEFVPNVKAPIRIIIEWPGPAGMPRT